MKSVDRLVDIIKRLRAPDGCPWDREQTHLSLRGHLVEECAELLEAIDNRDNEAMKEELGDVLMHLMLHAEIASEQSAFNFDDVAQELGDKLIRRHPHVFAGVRANDSTDVLKIWQQVKRQEKKARAVGGLFDGIPPQLSAMRLALDIAKKADGKIVEAANKNSISAERKLRRRARSEGPKNASDNKSADSLNFGRKIFNLILEASKNKVEPEAALRDYLSIMRKASEKPAEP